MISGEEKNNQRHSQDPGEKKHNQRHQKQKNQNNTFAGISNITNLTEKYILTNIQLLMRYQIQKLINVGLLKACYVPVI